MNKPLFRSRLRRIIEVFILNNPMTWSSEKRAVPGFRSQDVADRFGCSPAYVREIRAKMRKAGLIRNEPAGVLDAQVRVSVAQTATNIDIKNITAIKSPIQGSGP